MVRATHVRCPLNEAETIIVVVSLSMQIVRYIIIKRVAFVFSHVQGDQREQKTKDNYNFYCKP